MSDLALMHYHRARRRPPYQRAGNVLLVIAAR